MSEIIIIGIILGCVSIFGIICVCCDKQCRYKNCAENISNIKTEKTKTEETKTETKTENTIIITKKIYQPRNDVTKQLIIADLVLKCREFCSLIGVKNINKTIIFNFQNETFKIDLVRVRSNRYIQTTNSNFIDWNKQNIIKLLADECKTFASNVIIKNPNRLITFWYQNQKFKIYLTRPRKNIII